jgi:hypothetical protein
MRRALVGTGLVLAFVLLGGGASVALAANAAPVFTADTPPLDVYQAGTGPYGPTGGFAYTFAASGSPAPTFSVSSGALPTGVTLDSTTGELVGAPTNSGSFSSFSVTASNGVAPDAVVGPFSGYVYPLSYDGISECPEPGGYVPIAYGSGDQITSSSLDETDTGVTATETYGPATISVGEDHECKLWVPPGDQDGNINTGYVCPAGDPNYPDLCTLTVAREGSGSGSVTSTDTYINCGTTCSHDYDSEMPVSVTLTAAATGGSVFVGWSGGGCSGASASCMVTLDDDSPTVSAAFYPPGTMLGLAVSRTGSGTGTVTSSPGGVDCGSVCSGSFAAGSTVTLSATPGAGSVFAGWSGAGCSGTGTCTVSMLAASSVSAAFRQTVTTPPVVRPANSSPPQISGTPTSGKTLSCSEGVWTGSPIGYGYEWAVDGTPIAGAITSTYRVQAADEGTSLTCTVTATNAAGSAAANSRGVLVAVPRVARCPAATGKLSGVTLGLLRLGMTRAQALHAFAHSSNRGKKYEDFFCLTPRGVRVGIASPKLVKTSPKSERKLAGTVIWASTSSLYYSVQGVRCGATVAAAGKRLKLTGPFHIGLNYWYLAPNGASTAVFKVRGGIIEEIGIGDKALTDGHKAQVAFLTSFS